jgi:hypothetical protein
VTDANGNLDTDTATITVDSTVMINSTVVPAPRDLRFRTSGAITIRDILQNGAGGTSCTSCHASGGAYGGTGIPVWWTDGADQSIAGKGPADLPSLYDRAMTRVNLRDPETSLLLRKPSGNHHNGLLVGGFDLDGASTDHLAYDMFYTWIIEGAPQ